MAGVVAAMVGSVASSGSVAAFVPLSLMVGYRIGPGVVAGLSDVVRDERGRCQCSKGCKGGSDCVLTYVGALEAPSDPKLISQLNQLYKHQQFRDLLTRIIIDDAVWNPDMRKLMEDMSKSEAAQPIVIKKLKKTMVEVGETVTDLHREIRKLHVHFKQAMETSASAMTAKCFKANYAVIQSELDIMTREVYAKLVQLQPKILECAQKVQVPAPPCIARTAVCNDRLSTSCSELGDIVHTLIQQCDRGRTRELDCCEFHFRQIRASRALMFREWTRKDGRYTIKVALHDTSDTMFFDPLALSMRC